ncbi:hypothetical protein FRB99_003488, partial [Tulasnella sp. 403]
MSLHFWYLTLLLGTSVTLSAAASVDSAVAVVARGVPCPYMETKGATMEPASLSLRPAEGGDTETIQIRYLGHGSNGCVYDVQGGYKNPVTGVKEGAVYKTKRLDKDAPPLKPNEIAALQDNKLLWGLFSDDQGSKSGIAKKQSGKFIYNTPRWKEEFPNNYLVSNPEPETPEYDACMEFISGLFNKIAIAAQQFGAWDPYDVNWENFLWSDDLEHVVIVDLGNAKPIEGDVQQYWKLQVPKYLEALESQGAIPIEDNEVGIQG